MAMTGINHFISCDVIDREGKIRTNELWPQAICLVGIAPGNQMGTLRGVPPYLLGISPYVTIYGHGIPHWPGSTISRLGNTVIISNKYLTYSDGLVVHQNRLNNS